MVHLLQTRTLCQASLAAFISALACYPRLLVFPHHPEALWFLETTIFICGIVLWGFVFAWHEPYTGSPPFNFKTDPKLLALATVAALGVATVFYLWLDPVLRPKFPDEYPADSRQWLAAALFSFGLTQLFVVLAPCDWLMRLTKNRRFTMSATGILAAGVLALKLHSLTVPLSAWQTAALLAIRFLGGFLAIAIYLRGGVLLVWWWTLILEARLLLELPPV